MNRREFLQLGGGVAARLAAGAPLFAAGCDFASYGPLGEPDSNGIRLPFGFASRVLARQGDPVGVTSHLWHRAPDGGATFKFRNGWVYVSNSESNSRGGVGALRFDRRGEIVDAYSICAGTRRNCAGGATPWGTWLSCEEVRDGLVYECDPRGRDAARVRPALGRFNHEAVAVDRKRRHLYLTEDEFDGGLYRFTPNSWRRLDGGVLEIARLVAGGFVEWHTVPDPLPDLARGATPTRRQVPASARFRGGEGIVSDDHKIYFTTKFDNRVWASDPADQQLSVVYHAQQDPARQLTGVDNITATPTGELLVAEDGGNMELVVLSKAGVAQPLLRVEGQPFSELTGPAFDPSGERLYFSSQRGSDGRGITYEVSGPFWGRIGEGANVPRNPLAAGENLWRKLNEARDTRQARGKLAGTSSISRSGSSRTTPLVAG